MVYSYEHSLPHHSVHPPQRCLECRRTINSLCAKVSTQSLACIARFSHKIHLPPESLLIEEGGAAVASFIILSGTVRVFKSLADGRRQITGFIDAGQCINVGGCFEEDGEKGVYTFGAETIDNVYFCRFQYRNFNSLLTDLPDLWRVLLASATEQVAEAREQMLLLGRKTAREKIASFLLHRLTLSFSDSALTDNTPIVRLPMSRVDIADYLGLTVETVSRTMSAFRREKLIMSAGHHALRVLNVAALRAMAHGNSVHGNMYNS